MNEHFDVMRGFGEKGRGSKKLMERKYTDLWEIIYKMSIQSYEIRWKCIRTCYFLTLSFSKRENTTEWLFTVSKIYLIGFRNRIFFLFLVTLYLKTSSHIRNYNFGKLQKYFYFSLICGFFEAFRPFYEWILVNQMIKFKTAKKSEK